MTEKRRRSGYTRVSKGANVFSWAPQVSVVIPVYNASAHIGEALRSVAAQRFRDYEVIVVNDGTPDTSALENALSPHRQNIIYITQPNFGAGAARNTAIEHSRGRVIAFLDADDVWLPDYLSSQLGFLGRGHEMVYCDAQQFGMRSALRKTFMQQAPSTGEVTAAALLDFRCNVITSGTVALKSSIIKAGMFESERARAHDFHLWVRMAKSGARIGYQEKVLLKYRVHLDSLSGDSVSRVQREIDVFNRIEKSIELNDEERAILKRRLGNMQADLQIEFGKAFLLNEDFENAHLAFAEANRNRPSLKLTGVSMLAKFAPRILLNQYRKKRGDEIAFVPASVK
jgi:teichuronic acid biosynthesis glycosyltransferase TuaG